MVDRNQSLLTQDNDLTLHHRDVEMAQARTSGMKAEESVLNIAEYIDLKQIFLFFPFGCVIYHGCFIASISNSMQSLDMTI